MMATFSLASENTVPSDATTKKSRPLEDYPPEILIQIFEQLYAIDPSELSRILCLSRYMSTFIIPLLYRNITLRPCKVDSDSPDPMIVDLFSERLIAHCDRLVIPDYPFSPSFPGDVCHLLAKCTRVRDISWTYNFSTIMAQNEVEALCVAFSDIPLPLHLHLACFDSNVGSSATSRLELFPILRAVSFSLHKRFRKSSWKAINKMIVAAKNLESLELHHTTQKFAPIAGPLPPVLSLSLSQCRWFYTRDELLKIWNFSRLQHLSLMNLNTTELITLLEYFPAKHGSSLRTLQIVLKELPMTDPDVLIPSLEQLMKHCTLLEILDIPCRIQHFELSTFSNIKNLRVLKMRGTPELATQPVPYAPDQDSAHLDTHERHPKDPLSLVQHLQLFSRLFPLLRELDMGFDRERFEGPHIMNQIGCFRYMRSVTLRTQELRDYLGDHSACVALDLQLANALFDYAQDHSSNIKLYLVISRMRRFRLDTIPVWLQPAD